MAPTHRLNGKGTSNVAVRRVVRDVLLSKQEIKRGNTTQAATAWTTAGIVLPITQAIVQGDTIASRSGDRINPRSFDMNFIMTGGSVNCFGRIIIFQDMLNVGVDPTVAQVLDGGTFLSTYLLDTAQQHRFKIHYDQIFSCSNANAIGTTINTDSSFMAKQIHSSMRGKINFNGAGYATASNGPGALYALFISNVASGTGGNYSYYTSVTYTDS